jgi:hypothetical protein
MNKLFLGIFLILIISLVYADDNEIFVDQVGATANIDLEQLGSGNIIGGLDAQAGNMTALDLDGQNFTLDINMIGDQNKFLGDMYADSYTGFFEFDGDSNTFTSKMDPTNAFGADNSNVNVDVTGGSNTFTLDLATTALAGSTDLDWIVQGDSNQIDADINYDSGTNYMSVDGDSNNINFVGSGAAQGYFYIEHDGDSRTFDIDQTSTLDNDWLKVTSNGNNGTFCIQQNDQGSSVGC